MTWYSINAGTLNRIENTVREALIEYEPRIEVLEVAVSDAEARNGRLLISIDYLIRTSNHEFNLVFPFYIKEGQLNQ